MPDTRTSFSASTTLSLWRVFSVAAPLCELLMQLLTIFFKFSPFSTPPALHTWPPHINYFCLISGSRSPSSSILPGGTSSPSLIFPQWRKWATLRPGFVNTPTVSSRVSCGACCSHYTDHEKGDGSKVTSSHFKYIPEMVFWDETGVICDCLWGLCFNWNTEI